MNKLILDTINEHIAAVEYLKQHNADLLEQIADLTFEACISGGGVYLCGNGGSAADCQHIAGELIGRFRKERQALKAVALTVDTSVITCLGNDYDFSHIFVRQVEAMVGKGDCLWAFSTSGTSENVLKAARLAKQKGAKIAAFTGKPDSELEKLSDVCLCTNTIHTSTSQEVHQLAYHIICDLIEKKL